MRLLPKTTALAALLALAAGAFTAACLAQDKKDDDAPAPGQAEAAKAAMDKALARGKELWNDKSLFKKSCASCHENPDKPQLSMKTRVYSYPAFSRRKKGIVTMHQKIQEMVEYSAVGKPLDDKGTDIAALEAYVRSLKQ
jgi:cytochrome c